MDKFIKLVEMEIEELRNLNAIVRNRIDGRGRYSYPNPRESFNLQEISYAIEQFENFKDKLEGKNE